MSKKKKHESKDKHPGPLNIVDARGEP
ncbi:hypothetical protein LCGC14_2987640, partial [marine sediment metagenome]